MTSGSSSADAARAAAPCAVPLPAAGVSSSAGRAIAVPGAAQRRVTGSGSPARRQSTSDGWWTRGAKPSCGLVHLNKSFVELHFAGLPLPQTVWVQATVDGRDFSLRLPGQVYSTSCGQDHWLLGLQYIFKAHRDPVITRVDMEQGNTLRVAISSHGLLEQYTSSDPGRAAELMHSLEVAACKFAETAVMKREGRSQVAGPNINIPKKQLRSQWPDLLTSSAPKDVTAHIFIDDSQSYISCPAKIILTKAKAEPVFYLAGLSALLKNYSGAYASLELVSGRHLVRVYLDSSPKRLQAGLGASTSCSPSTTSAADVAGVQPSPTAGAGAGAGPGASAASARLQESDQPPAVVQQQRQQQQQATPAGRLSSRGCEAQHWQPPLASAVGPPANAAPASPLAQQQQLQQQQQMAVAAPASWPITGATAAGGATAARPAAVGVAHQPLMGPFERGGDSQQQEPSRKRPWAPEPTYSSPRHPSWGVGHPAGFAAGCSHAPPPLCSRLTVEQPGGSVGWGQKHRLHEAGSYWGPGAAAGQRSPLQQQQPYPGQLLQQQGRLSGWPDGGYAPPTVQQQIPPAVPPQQLAGMQVLPVPAAAGVPEQQQPHPRALGSSHVASPGAQHPCAAAAARTGADGSTVRGPQLQPNNPHGTAPGSAAAPGQSNIDFDFDQPGASSWDWRGLPPRGSTTGEAGLQLQADGRGIPTGSSGPGPDAAAAAAAANCAAERCPAAVDAGVALPPAPQQQGPARRGVSPAAADAAALPPGALLLRHHHRGPSQDGLNLLAHHALLELANSEPALGAEGLEDPHLLLGRIRKKPRLKRPRGAPAEKLQQQVQQLMRMDAPGPLPAAPAAGGAPGGELGQVAAAEEGGGTAAPCCHHERSRHLSSPASADEVTIGFELAPFGTRAEASGSPAAPAEGAPRAAAGASRLLVQGAVNQQQPQARPQQLHQLQVPVPIPPAQAYRAAPGTPAAQAGLPLSPMLSGSGSQRPRMQHPQPVPGGGSRQQQMQSQRLPPAAAADGYASDTDSSAGGAAAVAQHHSTWGPAAAAPWSATTRTAAPMDTGGQAMMTAPPARSYAAHPARPSVTGAPEDVSCRQYGPPPAAAAHARGLRSVAAHYEGHHADIAAKQQLLGRPGWPHGPASHGQGLPPAYSYPPPAPAHRQQLLGFGSAPAGGQYHMVPPQGSPPHCGVLPPPAAHWEHALYHHNTDGGPYMDALPWERPASAAGASGASSMAAAIKQQVAAALATPPPTANVSEERRRGFFEAAATAASIQNLCAARQRLAQGALPGYPVQRQLSNGSGALEVTRDTHLVTPGDTAGAAGPFRSGAGSQGPQLVALGSGDSGVVTRYHQPGVSPGREVGPDYGQWQLRQQHQPQAADWCNVEEAWELHLAATAAARAGRGGSSSGGAFSHAAAAGAGAMYGAAPPVVYPGSDRSLAQQYSGPERPLRNLKSDRMSVSGAPPSQRPPLMAPPGGSDTGNLAGDRYRVQHPPPAEAWQWQVNSCGYGAEHPAADASPRCPHARLRKLQLLQEAQLVAASHSTQAGLEPPRHLLRSSCSWPQSGRHPPAMPWGAMQPATAARRAAVGPADGPEWAAPTCPHSSAGAAGTATQLPGPHQHQHQQHQQLQQLGTSPGSPGQGSTGSPRQPTSHALSQQAASAAGTHPAPAVAAAPGAAAAAPVEEQRSSDAAAAAADGCGWPCLPDAATLLEVGRALVQVMNFLKAPSAKRLALMRRVRDMTVTDREWLLSTCYPYLQDACSRRALPEVQSIIEDLFSGTRAGAEAPAAATAATTSPTLG